VSSEPTLQVLRGRAGGPPALELALSMVMLEAVARAEHGPVLRCYCPPATVAFGRRDSFLPGFAAAARLAEGHGFAPVIRSAGGRAAAYDDGCLVIEEIAVDPSSTTAVQQRFAREAEAQALALRALGVDARVGEVPGEYCPGAFTVNARGRVKLVGAAQRVIRGGWLMSSVVVVERAAPLRVVLEDVYAALGLEWNPDTVGAISDEVPGITVEAVEAALIAAYARRYRLAEGEIPAEAIDAARGRMDRHVPAL
jgi:lipoate-protein ligase A